MRIFLDGYFLSYHNCFLQNSHKIATKETCKVWLKKESYSILIRNYYTNSYNLMQKLDIIKYLLYMWVCYIFGLILHHTISLESCLFNNVHIS